MAHALLGAQIVGVGARLYAELEFCSLRILEIGTRTFSRHSLEEPGRRSVRLVKAARATESWVQNHRFQDRFHRQPARQSRTEHDLRATRNGAPTDDSVRMIL